ncbi:SH3 domain-binding protein 4-like [Fundulus heteroclitus]|uniref:SH3 domain-binding protein 4-like n=1 Tax=Fundulus heteroclitus TaxID=8078 RepID=UPI00165CD5EA|nr:SH3 domain-binding protein 4-like [Fundulus heteroclitus]
MDETKSRTTLEGKLFEAAEDLRPSLKNERGLPEPGGCIPRSTPPAPPASGLPHPPHRIPPSSPFLHILSFHTFLCIQARPQALLKMDCQGLVARLVMDFVLLTTAVEVAGRWRELAERLAKVSRQQMDAYEAPHRDKNGVVDSEAMWKPAYDFLVTWAAQIGDSYRDVIQELHMGLDKMKSPITKRWKHLTGTLILVNSLDILRSSAFSPAAQDDYAI